MTSIADNLARIRARINEAARRAGRDLQSVRLVVVTKNHPVESLREVVAAGERDLGENRVQEAQAKLPELISGGLPGNSPGAGGGSPLVFPAGLQRPRFHFIGHLQTNKAKVVVRLFDWVHSVDSARAGEALQRECEKAGRESIDVLVESNVSGEESKQGIAAAEAEALVRELARFDRLRVRGFMTMAPFELEPEATRPVFRALRQLRDRLAALGIEGADLRELSMGMTNDFEVAIEEGATMVRIGTAVFE